MRHYMGLINETSMIFPIRDGSHGGQNREQPLCMLCRAEAQARQIAAIAECNQPLFMQALRGGNGSGLRRFMHLDAFLDCG